MDSYYLIFIAIVVFLMASMIFMIIRLLRKPAKQNRHLQQLAKNLGLELLPKKPGVRTQEVEGAYNGKIIKIYCITHKVNNYKTTQTAIRLLGANPLKLAFTITQLTWTKSFKQLLGSKRLQFGDSEFDRHFVVISNQSKTIHHVLSDSLRAKLLQIEKEFDFKGGIELQDDSMIYLEHEPLDTNRKQKRFEALVDFMSSLKDELDLYCKGN